MRKALYTLLLPVIACSCTGQEDKEEEYAGRMIDAARTLMTEGNYVAAKDSILAMRETFPTAFKARATGIIVMDSIELLAAQDTLAIMDSTLITGSARKYSISNNVLTNWEPKSNFICARLKWTCLRTSETRAIRNKIEPLPTFYIIRKQRPFIAVAARRGRLL